jgi:hypothetical protein
VGHVPGQPCGFVFAVDDDGLFNLSVDRLLSAIRGRDKSVETGQFQEKTSEANTARPDFEAD